VAESYAALATGKAKSDRAILAIRITDIAVAVVLDFKVFILFSPLIFLRGYQFREFGL
jgi:hypothetical protein